MSPQCGQQDRRRNKPSQHVWEQANPPPPLPVQRSNVANPWTTRTDRAQLASNHAEHAPERHPRHTPTDRAPPSPRAYTITTDSGDRQTSPFTAPCLTATARRRRRRLCRAERRVFQTVCHRPYMHIKAIEHRQETTKRSPPPAMPLAARSHVANVACPSRSVSSSRL